MSEGKLYAVKNDEDEWLDQYHLFGPGAWATPDKDEREKVAKCYGGHVVMLVEEPKKVAVSKEDARYLDFLIARFNKCNPDAISNIISKYSDDSWDMIDAYVNGYTVEKEKRYKVLAPKSWWNEDNTPEYLSFGGFGVNLTKYSDDIGTVFTQKQLDLYGLNGAPFTKEEVTNDDD